MSTIIVTSEGNCSFAGKTYRCALGKSGIVAEKKEGDHGTPQGIFMLEEVLYRPDRMRLPTTVLPVRTLAARDGWCDEPADANYNQFVALPHKGSVESLWRDDHVYDIVITTDFNRNPVIPGRGSAIFIHIAQEGYTPTEGCIALALEDLLAILAAIPAETRIAVRGNGDENVSGH